MTTGREKPMKKVSLLGKINYIFDKKQKRQLIGLGIMIFIGGILETLGVSGMIPVVTDILNPDELVNFVNKYQFLSDICSFFHVDLSRTGSITTILIVGLILIYIIKNAYILFLTYRQNTFISRSRNQMISRVLREFLN